MYGLPDVTVAGTLTADPELRYTQTGHAVTNFVVAANERRYDKTSGAWSDGDATFLRCSIWRDAAENVAESLRKGDRVLVTGRLKQRSYETDQGDKRTVFELDVTEIGPSLRWATAKVAKVTRTASKNDPGAADPWATPANEAGASAADEPPF
jgi:single-strand DNA-binding protein